MCNKKNQKCKKNQTLAFHGDNIIEFIDFHTDKSRIKLQLFFIMQENYYFSDPELLVVMGCTGI
jgi:hypothetical protein